ncbi:6615_t:CDS:2, partial [Gigaspora rosea]
TCRVLILYRLSPISNVRNLRTSLGSKIGDYLGNLEHRVQQLENMRINTLKPIGNRVNIPGVNCAPGVNCVIIVVCDLATYLRLLEYRIRQLENASTKRHN